MHPQYYKDTVIQQFRAPDFGDYDVLEAVLPEARKRGMKTICWFEDVWNDSVPNIAQAQEKRFDGSNATTLCFNNPNYRNWLLGAVEDYARSYEIDGIMWGSERQGAFANALGASHGGNGGGVARTTCFCQFCEAKAQGSRRRPGARPRRLSGAGAISCRRARQGKRPVDGYYVTLWRLMLRHPELLAWEMLWTDSLRETYAAIYNKVKSIKPVDRRRLAHLAQQLVQPDLSRGAGSLGADQVLGLPEDGDVSQLRRRAHGELHPQRRQQHLRRCPAAGVARLSLSRAGLQGREARSPTFQNRASPPTMFTAKRSAPARRSTARRRSYGRASTSTFPPDRRRASPARKARGTRWLAALRAGSDGVLLSRKYSEMKLANLRGAGDAIKEAGLA